MDFHYGICQVRVNSSLFLVNENSQKEGITSLARFFDREGKTCDAKKALYISRFAKRIE